ncbi:MAG: ABC transporter permease, partial [Oscillospiraceae bacterium]
GSPFATDRPMPPKVEQALKEKYNLDAPVYEQYFDYMSGLAVGDLGSSMQMLGVEVTDIIKTAFPVSARVGGLAVLMVVALGIPLGVIAALRRGKTADYAVSIFSTMGITIPSFVIATFIIYIFAEKLGWIPTNGLSNWRSYIGPVIALGGFSLAFVTRLMRSSYLEVISQDYIRTARANGLSRSKILFKHALKNALIPVITYIGPAIAGILTGSFVVEKIFTIPGMGKYFVESIGNRDYSLVMGVTLFFAAFYIFMVFLVDLAYAAIDPRIKPEQ